MQTTGEAIDDAQTLEVSVVEVSQLSANSRLIVFKYNAEQALEFRAGQYLQIHLPEQNRWLPLSIANAPGAQCRLEIIVKEIEGGLGSQYLFSLSAGDQVKLRAAYGLAWLRDPVDRALIIAVGSSGISYARSLINDVFGKHPEANIHLFYAVQSVVDFCLMDEWQALETQHQNFLFTPVIAEEDNNWQGETGLITEVMEKCLTVADGTKVDAYTAGPPPMVTAVVELLTSLTVPERQIYSDMFSSRPMGDVQRMLSADSIVKRITTPISSGEQYLQSLRDGRNVWIDGERVNDVTQHPAFANATQFVAGLYDLQNAPEMRDRLTFEMDDGRRAHMAYLLPRHQEDLARRRAAMEISARLSYGFFNRGPEYKSGFLVGMMSNLPFFGKYADNVEAFYKRVASNNIYLNHVFVTPQVDRARPPSEQPESHLYVGAVRETESGIIVRGAKMVGTAAALNHEIVVGHYGGIRALSEADRDYALMFTVPVNAPGVRLLARGSMRKESASAQDAPMSHYLEENDLTVVFDDVFVPWEDVFIYRDIQRTNTWMVETPSLLNLIYNNAIRFHQKLQFLSGLAQRIAQSTDIEGFQGVRVTLGKLAVHVGTLKGLIRGAEAAAIELPSGVVMPDPEIILAYRGLGPEIYPEVIDLIEKLAGGGLIQLPASLQDIQSDGPLADDARYYRGANLDGVQRATLMKLAWDVLRSDYGGRHVLFERFHAGAPDDALIQYYMGTDAKLHGELVDEMLGRVDADVFLDPEHWKNLLQKQEGFAEL